MSQSSERPRGSRAKAPLLRIELSAKTMLVALLIACGAWVTLALAPVLLVLVVALFLVGTLNPAVEWLEQKRIKRGTGIALVFFSMFALLAAILALTLPVLVAQVTALAAQGLAARGRVADYLERSRFTDPLASSLRNLHYETLFKASAPAAFEFSRRSVETTAYLVSAVFLALYMVIDRDRLRGGLYALVPRKEHIRLSRVLVNLELIVGGYIRGQVLTSVLMSVFTFALLSVCGVKSALAISVFAGVADVLPYIGVILSVGPAVAAAFAQGPVTALIVLAAMLAYEEFESRFLVPKIYGSALKLPSSIVLFSLLAGGTLMGIPGALLALPVAATVRMLITELRIELPGEDIDDSKRRARDERAEHEYEQRAAGVRAEKAAAIAVQISEKRVALGERPSRS
jgi:predicted PurR-regulated permease PerM